MNKRKLMASLTIVGLLFWGAVSPSFAETAKDTTRIEKLEERTRDLEARMAKVEASSQQQMGKMMQHEHGMMGKGMAANSAMGQMPQQMPPQDPGMANSAPQGGAAQQQGGAMPSSGAMGGDM